MAPLHKALFPRLVAAVNGDPVIPLYLERGPLNYRLMDAAVGALGGKDQTLGYLLGEMRELGHLAVRGGGGKVACEQGSPAAHWAFNVGAVAGFLWRSKGGGLQIQREGSWSGVMEAAKSFLEDEAGLDLAFRWGGRVALPAPRVKGGVVRGKNDPDQAPVDGYRDCFTRLMAGEVVNRPEKFWRADLALAVRATRDLLNGGVLETLESKRAAAGGQGWSGFACPKLHLPITRANLVGGGYLAWIEDTPEARRVMGKDACHWAALGPQGLDFGLDWEPIPPRYAPLGYLAQDGVFKRVFGL